MAEFDHKALWEEFKGSAGDHRIEVSLELFMNFLEQGQKIRELEALPQCDTCPFFLDAKKDADKWIENARAKRKKETPNP